MVPFFEVLLNSPHKRVTLFNIWALINILSVSDAIIYRLLKAQLIRPK